MMVLKTNASKYSHQKYFYFASKIKQKKLDLIIGNIIILKQVVHLNVSITPNAAAIYSTNTLVDWGGYFTLEMITTKNL